MQDGSEYTESALDQEALVDTSEIMRKIKFESELDLAFGEKVAAKAYGQNLLSCIQCGTCSATCPMSHYMDYTPRRIIAMTREGFKNEVLHSATIWLCASCYSCTVQCPRQIGITDIMYTLKREAMARGMYPKRYPIPVLARNFHDLVRTHGRNSEGWLILRLFLQTNPFKAFQQMRVGLNLMLTGRFSMRFEHIRNKAQLRTLHKDAMKRGVPLGPDGYFFEPLWTTFTIVPEAGVLDWFTVIMGLVGLTTLTTHGALYLALKTDAEVQRRARRAAIIGWWTFGIILTTGYFVFIYRIFSGKVKILDNTPGY